MKLCVITGESSGDIHAADLVAALRRKVSDLTLFGTGGDALRGEGMTILKDVRAMGIVGLFNVLRHVPMYLRLRAELIRRVSEERPDAVVLVDYPDFNLSLARGLRQLDIPVIYYISPQVWAWRSRRVRQIARCVDHMIVIFPFEEAFYSNHGVPVTYVGHPLVDQLAPHVEALNTREKLEPPVRIALLPGSRPREVRDLLPAMLDAVRLISSGTSVEAFVVKAGTIEQSLIEEICSAHRLREVDVKVLSSGRQALVDADVALASSGTATLECAILEVPAVVMYRLSALTYALARRLVKIPHFSLVNIVAGRQLVPELLQHQVSASRIAAETMKLLEPDHRRSVLRGLRDVRSQLGEGGAADRAADVILQVTARSPEIAR